MTCDHLLVGFGGDYTRIAQMHILSSCSGCKPKQIDVYTSGSIWLRWCGDDLSIANNDAILKCWMSARWHGSTRVWMTWSMQKEYVKRFSIRDGMPFWHSYDV